MTGTLQGWRLREAVSYSGDLPTSAPGLCLSSCRPRQLVADTLKASGKGCPLRVTELLGFSLQIQLLLLYNVITVHHLFLSNHTLPFSPD